MGCWQSGDRSALETRRLERVRGFESLTPRQVHSLECVASHGAQSSVNVKILWDPAGKVFIDTCLPSKQK